MAVQTDFMAAVNQIAAERNISVDEVVEAIAEAIKSGFRQNYPVDTDVILKVDIDPIVGSIGVYQVKTVVSKVENENTEVSIKDAKSYLNNPTVGDTVEIDITPEGDFGRVAAQSAKQAILQKIREAERETQLREFTDKLGEVEYAVVQRMDGDAVIWEVGKAIATMPLEDRIPNEFYKSGSRHKVLLKDIRMTPRGKMLIVSRSDPDFLRALFELEVPELTTESVEIKAIAREAGSRSKVAVTSNVQGIDPIGSCVGQKGMRINSIMNELRFGEREEKIDIILWDEDEKEFLANALSPADVKKVEILDEETRRAKLTVDDEHLSLAIGKDGQNVRLAAKLTEWKIDIVGSGGDTAMSAEPEETAGEAGETEAKEEKAEKPAKKAAAKKTAKSAKATKKAAKAEGNELAELGLSTRIVNILGKAGISTAKELKKYSDDYTQIAGVAAKSAEEIAAKVK